MNALPGEGIGQEHPRTRISRVQKVFIERE